MIETNFLSVVALTKAVVTGMIERNRGHIVNMSSIAGKEAYHGGGLYCGSKFALVSGSTPGGRPLLALGCRGCTRGCLRATVTHSLRTVPSSEAPARTAVVDQQATAPRRHSCHNKRQHSCVTTHPPKSVCVGCCMCACLCTGCLHHSYKARAGAHKHPCDKHPAR